MNACRPKSCLLLAPYPIRSRFAAPALAFSLAAFFAAPYAGAETIVYDGSDPSMLWGDWPDRTYPQASFPAAA